VTRLSRLMYGEGYEILSLTKSKEKPLMSTDVALIMDLQLKRGLAHSEIIKMLSEQDFVNYIEEI
ncbi:MAG: MgtC/SapB family protein, partial [Butyrivibrio sp.]|nr:MgtC/SapB family protein [Butyrivibrio sp.]